MAKTLSRIFLRKKVEQVIKIKNLAKENIKESLSFVKIFARKILCFFCIVNYENFVVGKSEIFEDVVKANLKGEYNEFELICKALDVEAEEILDVENWEEEEKLLKSLEEFLGSGGEEKEDMEVDKQPGIEKTSEAKSIEDPEDLEDLSTLTQNLLKKGKKFI